MTARGCLHCLAALACWLGAAVAQPAPPAKGTELFVGIGTVGWLPKTKVSMLPTAAAIETLAQKLNSRLRNVDPFGLATFPRERDQTATPAELGRTADRVTLNQALQTLRVTGISLENKEFLISGRNVFEGDVVMLAFKNEVFLAQVVEVGATEIRFRDVKRQEAGALPHSLLPQLQMEPMQNRSAKDGLEGKVSPMETFKSPQKQ